jgi:Glycosyltransferase family 87
LKSFSLDRLLLVAAALYFLVAGASQAWKYSYDFTAVYCGARCLLHGCDPYDTRQLSLEYSHAGGTDPAFQEGRWPSSYPPVYPPAVFVVVSPVSVLGFPAARMVWFLLNAGLFVWAVSLILSACPESYRWLANLLAACFLSSGVILLKAGQPACAAVSLLIIACVLFWRRKQMVLAACLLCLSLAIKPQIGGLVALYLLIEKPNRRYVAAAMAGAFAILILGAGTLQLHPGSQTWLADLRGNVAASLLPGHINDPSFPSAGEVNLQSAAIIAIPDARIASLLTYGVVLILLALWAGGLAKSRWSEGSRFLGLGALVVFSMLPVYHRDYDIVLLLLTIPMIVAVVRQRQALGFLIAAITLLAIAPIQRNASAWLMTHHPALRLEILAHRIWFLLVLREQILATVVLFCLYLAAIYLIRPAAEPTLAANALSGHPEGSSSGMRVEI